DLDVSGLELRCCLSDTASRHNAHATVRVEHELTVAYIGGVRALTRANLKDHWYRTRLCVDPCSRVEHRTVVRLVRRDDARIGQYDTRTNLHDHLGRQNGTAVEYAITLELPGAYHLRHACAPRLG